MKYTTQEIKDRADQLATTFEQGIRPDLVIDDPVLIALYVAARDRADDAGLDTAITAAREAGHTWETISTVLHAGGVGIAAH